MVLKWAFVFVTFLILFYLDRSFVDNFLDMHIFAMAYPQVSGYCGRKFLIRILKDKIGDKNCREDLQAYLGEF